MYNCRDRRFLSFASSDVGMRGDLAGQVALVWCRICSLECTFTMPCNFNIFTRATTSNAGSLNSACKFDTVLVISKLVA
jgi:hypothetical protein